jgi:hypothetical protein
MVERKKWFMAALIFVFEEKSAPACPLWQRGML